MSAEVDEPARPVPYRIGAGLASALGAGLLWGLVFIAPLLLADYPAVVLSVGRYLAFGLFALPLAWLDRRRIARLTRADWIEAAKLSLVGNLIYYGFLAAAIQTAGAPLPTMIIGTLPVVIAVCANLTVREIQWRSLVWPLAIIGLGIALVNRDEWRAQASSDGQSLLFGALLATVAVACWTWYPIRNSRWLRKHPELRSDTWASAQGLTTLPLAVIGAGLLYLLDHPPVGFESVAGWAGTGSLFAGWSGRTGFDWPLGPRPLTFVSIMLAVGLLASWLGTMLWNRSSKLLPTALAGQLIVFETLAALLYAYLLRGSWPAVGTGMGIAMLILGVSLAVRRFDAAPPAAP